VNLVHSWVNIGPKALLACNSSLLRSNQKSTPTILSQSNADDDALSTTKNIYSMPALYDLAFGYRDYEEEVNFLIQVHEKIATMPPSRILELAAGPGRHAIAALQQRDIQKVTCIDLSPEMAEYSKEIAVDELPHDKQSCFTYLVDDMRSFNLDPDEIFDTCWILLGSLQHLTSNPDVIQCFQSVHKHLKSGGTLIVELPHPRETFSMTECTRNGWQVPLEDEDGIESGSLKIIWGDDDDEFDPIQQVRQFTVRMELTGVEASELSEGVQNVREVVPMRLFTAQEIDALAGCAGFKVTEMYGALEEGVNINDEDAAFRLVCVLCKQ